MRKAGRSAVAAAASGLVALALAGCSGDDGLVVGGGNITESRILAEIYAGALSAEGIDATARPDIGTREAYLGALQDGSVDIFPEYTGNLTVYYDPSADADTEANWYEELVGVLPDDLVALEMSPAQNNDSVTVTRETADEYGLERISDLEPVAGELVLGGPPEWATRERTGVPALVDVYGLSFEGEYRPLEGPLTVQGLVDGQIDAGNVFTTDPAIVRHDLVVLEDDQYLFPTNNVVPIASDGLSDEAIDVLNAVSAALDTEQLSELNQKVDVDDESVSSVAREWLEANDLG